MGLNYSFELVAERASADRVIRAISDHLISEDRDRLLACVPFDLENPLGKIRRSSVEQGIGELCLDFLFPPDGVVEGYNPDRASVNGLIPVGCVWTSIEIESRLVIFRATAATTGMSHLFERSPSIRNAWNSIAECAGALILLFDYEQFVEHRCLWPVERLLDRPPSENSAEEESRYLTLVRAAGVTLSRAGAEPSAPPKPPDGGDRSLSFE